jgi:dsRNA-specific ribonuclease
MRFIQIVNRAAVNQETALSTATFCLDRDGEIIRAQPIQSFGCASITARKRRLALAGSSECSVHSSILEFQAQFQRASGRQDEPTVVVYEPLAQGEIERIAAPLDVVCLGQDEYSAGAWPMQPHNVILVCVSPITSFLRQDLARKQIAHLRQINLCASSGISLPSINTSPMWLQEAEPLWLSIVNPVEYLRDIVPAAPNQAQPVFSRGLMWDALCHLADDGLLQPGLQIDMYRLHLQVTHNATRVATFAVYSFSRVPNVGAFELMFDSKDIAVTLDLSKREELTGRDVNSLLRHQERLAAAGGFAGCQRRSRGVGECFLIALGTSVLRSSSACELDGYRPPSKGHLGSLQAMPVVVSRWLSRIRIRRYQLDNCLTDVTFEALCIALTPSSACESITNGPMAAAGRAYLKFKVTEALYHDFPKCREGEMTQMRDRALSIATLATAADKIKLTSLLLPLLTEANVAGSPLVLTALVGAHRKLKWVTPTEKFRVNSLKALFAACALCSQSAAIRLAERLAIPVARGHHGQPPQPLLPQINVPAFSAAIGYTFVHAGYAHTALTHPSKMPNAAFDRLEFFGDGILEWVKYAALFRATGIDVSTRAAEELSNKYLGLLGRRVFSVERWMQASSLVVNRSTQQAIPTKQVADVVEALVGAIYLDAGSDLATVQRVFGRWERMQAQMLGQIQAATGTT